MAKEALPRGNAAAGKQDEGSNSDVLTVSYDELNRATNNFSENIGNGGFGTVYRGNLRGEEVAVKMLSVPGDPHQEKAFRHEVDILGKLKHQHLVRLIGACPEKYVIVYEFMPGGTLDDKLVKEELLWMRRLPIMTEICDALKFLHSPNPDIVVHGDVKPENVLFDRSGRIKLGDFGISRRMPISNTTTTIHHTTDAKGSSGYMDPALFQSRRLAPNADVYSFGMLLLRLLTKEKPRHDLIGKVQDKLKVQHLEDLLDTTAKWPYQLAEELSKLALKCCNYPVNCRPNMTHICEVLEKMEREYIHNKPSSLKLQTGNSSLSKLKFSYFELQRATSNFSKASKLREVVFGEMYRGNLWDSEVAIHILFNSDDALLTEAFLPEVGVLDSLKHPHIIPFMGTCIEKYALVYECIPEGTLEDRLVRKDLLWHDRIRIATEICSAIQFLQKQKPDIIIRGDFPPKGILLDTSGRSMLYSFTTYGDGMLPSYWFGSLLLYLLANDRDLNLLLAAADMFKLGNAFETLVDYSAKWPSGLAEELFDLAQRCCNNNVEDSPTIAEVLDQLIEMKKSYLSSKLV